MSSNDTSRHLAAQHRKVAVVTGLLAVSMLAAAYAAVPLYSIFCQVTGYGGTTQRSDTQSDTILERKITVLFDANTRRGLHWRFQPVERKVILRIGETKLAFYRATNLSDEPVTGTASFNVVPEIAGSYFNKIECFCFTEQTLQPGQTVDMPVSFFIDPDFAKDPDASIVEEITLSYTFYPSQKTKAVPGRPMPELGKKKPASRANSLIKPGMSGSRTEPKTGT